MRINVPRWGVRVALVCCAVAAVVLAVLYASSRRRARVEPSMQPPVTVRPEEADPWKEAALKIEEDRGEPAGRSADVAVPAELRHGPDRRRFLAVQVAEWRAQRLTTPHDYAELASLIGGGELVEAPPLGDDYILYGVGYGADDGPFTHYDGKTNRGVTLYAGDEELRAEYERLAAARSQLEETIEGLEKESAALPRRERERNTGLSNRIREERKALDALKKRRALLDEFYKNPERRARLAEEHETVAALARDFGGRAYDLGDAAARKDFKARMLSFMRPAALRLMQELARSYREKFGRHLPVTSLVRTDEYQRRLGETNPNATMIDVPPHTTGLAFDVYYRYMTAAEQEHVMSDIARMRGEGRLTALRELRDHFHIFVFAEGRPPPETLVREALGEKPEQSASEKPEPAAKSRAAAKSKAAAKPKAPAKKQAAARRRRK